MNFVAYSKQKFLTTQTALPPSYAPIKKVESGSTIVIYTYLSLSPDIVRMAEGFVLHASRNTAHSRIPLAFATDP